MTAREYPRRVKRARREVGVGKAKKSGDGEGTIPLAAGEKTTDEMSGTEVVSEQRDQKYRGRRPPTAEGVGGERFRVDEHRPCARV